MSNTHKLGRSFPAGEMEPQSDNCLFEDGLPEGEWKSLLSPSSHLWRMMSMCFVSLNSTHVALVRLSDVWDGTQFWSEDVVVPRVVPEAPCATQ